MLKKNQNFLIFPSLLCFLCLTHIASNPCDASNVSSPLDESARLLVFGPIAVGKTSLCRSLLGIDVADLQVGPCLQMSRSSLNNGHRKIRSTNETCESRGRKFGLKSEVQVTCIDTPGLDIHRSDHKLVATNIENFLRHYKEVNLFLLTVDGSDYYDVSKSSLEAVIAMNQISGLELQRKMVIVISHWSQNTREKVRRNRFFLTEKKFCAKLNDFLSWEFPLNCYFIDSHYDVDSEVETNHFRTEVRALSKGILSQLEALQLPIEHRSGLSRNDSKPFQTIPNHFKPKPKATMVQDEANTRRYTFVDGVVFAVICMVVGSILIAIFFVITFLILPKNDSKNSLQQQQVLETAV